MKKFFTFRHYSQKKKFKGENYYEIASLIIGILGMVLAGIAVVVCLLLPAMTNNHVSRSESMMGIIPAVVVFFLAFCFNDCFGDFRFEIEENRRVVGNESKIKRSLKNNMKHRITSTVSLAVRMKNYYYSSA